MNESTIWNSAVAITVKGLEMWAPMEVQCVALCTVLVFANIPAIAFAESSCPGIHVEILDIRNST